MKTALRYLKQLSWIYDDLKDDSGVVNINLTSEDNLKIKNSLLEIETLQAKVCENCEKESFCKSFKENTPGKYHDQFFTCFIDDSIEEKIVIKDTCATCSKKLNCEIAHKSKELFGTKLNEQWFICFEGKNND